MKPQPSHPRRRVAYLVNHYPAVSHAFIRREILALEHAGWVVDRFSIQPPADDLPDPTDRDEARRTTTLLESGAAGLLDRLPATLASPSALRKAFGLGRRSDRGLARHGVYLLEAARLVQACRARGTRHVHAHFGTNPAAVAQLAHRLDPGLSYSFTVHGPEEFDRPGPLKLRDKVADAAFVAAISSFTRAQLFRWADHADWDRIHVVRCGLDDAFLEAAGEEPALTDIQSRDADTPPTLVCIGRLCEQKGQLLLVRAAAMLRDRGVGFRLTLVGDGPMREAVEAEVRRLRMDDTVEITGFVSSDAVRRHLTDARAMVLGSFAEGLPVVLMESLAVRRPVVTTYLAGIPELVRDRADADNGNGWLVPMGDVDALADAMEQAVTADVEALAAMGERGREDVLTRHHAATEAARLAGHFAEALGLPGRDGNQDAAGVQVDGASPSMGTAPQAADPGVVEGVA